MSWPEGAGMSICRRAVLAPEAVKGAMMDRDRSGEIEEKQQARLFHQPQGFFCLG